MQDSNIAVQLYTLRDFAKTPEALRTTFQKLADIGYTAAQVSGIGPIDPAQVKEYADESGLKICATHVSWDRLENDLDALARQHQGWGCKYVGLGCLPDQYQTSQDGYRTFAKRASEIALRLKEQYGLQLIYHNHDFEFERFDGITGMDILLNESNHDSFGFELDLFWVQAGGGDPIEWTHKVKGRMQVVHLKDMTIVERSRNFAELGEGNMNYKGIIDACRQTGVEWYVVEQDVCHRDPFESVSISLDYLRRIIREGTK